MRVPTRKDSAYIPAFKRHGTLCDLFEVRHAPKRHGDTYSPKRGEAIISEDGRDYGYRVPRGQCRDFKSLASAAFGYRTITGRYPYYSVEDDH